MEWEHKQGTAGLAQLVGETAKASARSRRVNATGRIVQCRVCLLQLESSLDGLVGLAVQLLLVNAEQFKVRIDFLNLNGFRLDSTSLLI